MSKKTKDVEDIATEDTLPPVDTLPSGDALPSGVSIVAAEPAAPAPGIELEQAMLYELNEAAKEAYTAYSDKLYEHGELQATAWAGLNESHQSAWRAAVKYVRDGEALHAGS